MLVLTIFLLLNHTKGRFERRTQMGTVTEYAVNELQKIPSEDPKKLLEDLKNTFNLNKIYC